ncbi:MAG TPA: hypothetical protein VIO58_13095 [Candidatus Methanoperedens sp.]
MVDLTITPTPLIIALSITNIILLIIAVFLFMKCRKLGKKCDPKKEEKNSLAGIADINPKEFKPERFDLKPQDVIPVKTEPKTLNSGAVPEISIQGKSPLKLEDELPELEEPPKKKSARKKKSVKKVPKVAVKEVAAKEAAAGTEVIPIKNDVVATNTEHETVAKEVIKELTEIAPVKKTTRRKKAVKKEAVEAAKEVVVEKTEVPVQVPVENKTAAPIPTGQGMNASNQANLPK